MSEDKIIKITLKDATILLNIFSRIDPMHVFLKDLADDIVAQIQKEIPQKQPEQPEPIDNPNKIPPPNATFKG